MRVNFGPGLSLAFVLLAGCGLPALHVPLHKGQISNLQGVSSEPTVQPRPFVLAMSSDGASSSAIGLSWSGGPGFWYNDYYVYEGPSSSGPWSILFGGYTSLTSGFVAGLLPDTTYYFYIHDVYASGSVDSSVLSVATTSALQLSGSASGLTSESLTWANHAYYTPLLGFLGYQV